LYETQQLILGISYAIYWMMEPYWQYLTISHGLYCRHDYNCN
jgi:hypothetical protein